jgi:hypothetical protein
MRFAGADRLGNGRLQDAVATDFLNAKARTAVNGIADLEIR